VKNEAFSVFNHKYSHETCCYLVNGRSYTVQMWYAVDRQKNGRG